MTPDPKLLEDLRLALVAAGGAKDPELAKRLMRTALEVSRQSLTDYGDCVAYAAAATLVMACRAGAKTAIAKEVLRAIDAIVARDTALASAESEADTLSGFGMAAPGGDA